MLIYARKLMKFYEGAPTETRFVHKQSLPCFCQIQIVILYKNILQERSIELFVQ